ncbi:polysaccharide biosynthesis protein [Candidatus Bathyarchaeota archaeon]|nr:polysaccharide biosynthesis protein [Candidatus Bathyarchaeota archaeon]MBS7613490.1 polysaccharide biosynthesis protein [Candidatus Bathyarchaeota archaeon]MBS7618732.1 polysaccharide biosynthesis protein [Candidatus Bathyarchaeota archaeon]
MTEATELSITSAAVGSVYLTLQNIFSTLIGVLGYAYMARVITQEEMGVIAGVTMLCSLIQTGIDLGICSSIAKLISEDIGRGLDYSKHIVSALMLRLALILTVTLQVAIFSTYVSEALFKTPVYSKILTFASVSVAFLSMSSLLNSILWGSGRLKKMAIYGISSTSVRWVSITLFLFSGYRLIGVIYGWIIGDLTLFTILAISTLKHVNFNKNILSETIKLLPSMLKFSIPIYFGSIISFLYTWYDKALILMFLPIQQLGMYNVAYKAFSVFVAIASSLSSSLLPYYGVMYGKNDHKAISEGVKRASKYTMLIMFPLAFGLSVVAKPVITLFAGAQYSEAWNVLTILSIFGLVYGILPSFSSLLLVYGRTKTILLLDVVSVIVSLVFFPILWRLNLIGLTIVKGLSLIASFALSFYYTSRIVKIEVDKYMALKTLISSIIMAVVVLTLQQTLQNNLLFPLYVVTGAVIYIVLARVLKCIGKEDTQLIRAILGERSAKIIMKILNI